MGNDGDFSERRSLFGIVGMTAAYTGTACLSLQRTCLVLAFTVKVSIGTRYLHGTINSVQ